MWCSVRQQKQLSGLRMGGFRKRGATGWDGLQAAAGSCLSATVGEVQQAKARAGPAVPLLWPLVEQSHTDGTEISLSVLSTQAAPAQNPTSTFPPQGQQRHDATSCKPAPCPAASSPQPQHAQAPGANLRSDGQPRSVLPYAAPASRAAQA